VAVRGGEVTRVEFDLTEPAAAKPPAVAAPPTTSRPWVERLTQALPQGWKAVMIPRLSVDRRSVEQRLGGKIARLWNSRFLAHGEAVMINVIEAATDADLAKIEKAMLSMKDKAFCYRADDRTIVEFVGRFDAEFARRLARELNLPPNEEIPPATTGQVQINPPVVVQTVPRSGDVEVDPGLTEIRVTFSKDMAEGCWSWSQLSDDTFPATTGQPRYLPDRRTCVLPVNLAPGRTYAIWLNSHRFTNFRDARGNPAVPYLLIFETSGPTEE
jgi:RNA polymerase sigma-70 factor (ECF subfamily)